jgi:class 3 adenylate cyclase/tetratricopeptide (TPR) repeat protein
MRCPSCGTENRPGRKFCAECGVPLALACPACGAANEPGERFCGECGAALEENAAAPPRQPPAPAAERRLVSVLFADLVGSTPAAEGQDPEDVRELLSRYFDVARRVVERFGGTVEKFIGDAVMAVWGAPTAREDDAERAVRAALDLVDAVAALGEETGTGLRARAAVLTGEAAVTVGAEGQGMVAGDLVNTASRVQGIAEPGAVLVGDATKRASQAAIVYEEAGTHELKGKSEPVEVWRALRIVAVRGGEGKSVGLEAPFVGREGELRLVKELFHSTAEEGKARLVTITGLAGVGKSRLSWEFEKYVDGIRQVVLWHRGRCLPYGEGVAYWALAEMVRMRLGIAEEEDANSAREKLRAGLEEYVTSPDERSWLEPRLGHLLGLSESTPDREDLFSAWRLFFERLAEVNPTILVLEDLQWADRALIDFVEHLLEWSRNHALFVLTLARPELAERYPDWTTGKRNFISIFLEPLPDQAIEVLLQALVPGLPDDLRAAIRERAEGIPLYAVETVRMLLDRGLLERVGDEYRPTGPIEALAVPETLQALIAARLDGLPPEERRVLADASVLGKTFSREAVEALGVGTADLEPVLAALVRKEVLIVESDPRSPERGYYGFLQALVQKVAHDTLSRREQKSRHLAAAAYFETGWGSDDDELPEIVASHYLDAYRADPDAEDAPGIKAKAAAQLERAGQRAASLAAPAEALRYFDQAAELADDSLTCARLLEQAAQSAEAAADFDRAIACDERAADLFSEAGHSHDAARVAAHLGGALWLKGGDFEDAIGRLESAYEVLAEDQPDADLARLCAQLGRLHYFTGGLDAAAKWVERALAIAEPLWLPDLIADALNTKHLILHYSQGRPEEALALLQHALALGREHGLSHATLRAAYNLGHTLDCRDRYEAALSQDLAGLDLARRRGDRNWEVSFLNHVCGDQYMLGNWDEALAAIETLGEIGPGSVFHELALEYIPAPFIAVARGEPPRTSAEELVARADPGDLQTRAALNAARGVTLLAEGRAEEALAAAEPAFLYDHWHIFCKNAYPVAVEAALAAGDEAAVERLLAHVRELAPGATPPFLRGHVARFEARLAARDGDLDRAAASFAGAAATFREISARYWLGVTLGEHAETLAAGGRSDDAAALSLEAKELLEEVGARPWLERLDALEGLSGELELGPAPATP